MQTLTMYVGRRSGKQTFAITNFASERDRDMFRLFVSQLIDESTVPEESFCVLSSLGGAHQGELILVLPGASSDETEGWMRAVVNEATRRLSLRFERKELPASDYDACSSFVRSLEREAQARYN